MKPFPKSLPSPIATISVSALGSILLATSAAAQFTPVDAGNMDFGTAVDDQNTADSTVHVQNFTWANTGSYTPPSGTFTVQASAGSTESNLHFFVNHPVTTPSSGDYYGFQVSPNRPATYTATLAFDSALTLDPYHVISLQLAGGIDVEGVTVRAYNGASEVNLAGYNPFDPSSGGAGFDGNNFNVAYHGAAAYAPTLAPNGLGVDITGFGIHLVAPEQEADFLAANPGYTNYIVDDGFTWPNVNATWGNIPGLTTTPITVTHFTWEFAHQTPADSFDNNSIAFSASLTRLEPVPEPSPALLLVAVPILLLLRRRRPANA